MEPQKLLAGIIKLPANFMRFLITIYQLTISKALGPCCRYYPSCSHYARLSYQIHGFWKGTILTVWRLLRCNPLTDGGVDYPPLRGAWTNPWTHPGSVTAETYGISPNEDLVAADTVSSPDTRVEDLAGDKNCETTTFIARAGLVGDSRRPRKTQTELEVENQHQKGTHFLCC